MTDPILRYVGLDVHKRVVEACIVDHAGKIVQRERFALNRGVLKLVATKILRPTDEVALETTTNCWAVADALRPHVARVVVSNTMATKAIAQAKVKTDKVDAHVLAQLLRCDFLPEVWQPDEATRLLRELCGRRSSLVGDRTAMRNRIHSVLAMRLVEAPERLFSSESLQWLRTVELDAQARLLIDSDLRRLDRVQEEIDGLDEELARRAYASEAARLLMTLPGVDVVTALAILAAWGDPARFPDADHAASYLGLVPSTKQSAEHCYHGPITKRGNSQARWMLIEAAQHLDKHPGPLGHFFRRLLRKKNRNVAVVAAARKLAVIAWEMLTTGEPYRYAIPRSTETKLSRLRVKATGERRKTGPRKGQKCVAKLPGQPGGSRTIRSLAEVCQSEGLPSPRPLSPGEKRTVKQAGAEPLVARISAPQVVPRRSRTVREADAHGGNGQQTAGDAASRRRPRGQVAAPRVAKPAKRATPANSAKPAKPAKQPSTRCPRRGGPAGKTKGV
jgi:transposase